MCRLAAGRCATVGFSFAFSISISQYSHLQLQQSATIIPIRSFKGSQICRDLIPRVKSLALIRIWCKYVVISCHFFHSPTEILRDPLMDFFLLVATTAGFDLAKKRCRCLKLLLTFASVVLSLSFQCKKSLFFPCLKWDLHGFAVFGTLAKPPCLFSGYCCLQFQTALLFKSWMHETTNFVGLLNAKLWHLPMSRQDQLLGSASRSSCLRTPKFGPWTALDPTFRGRL